MSGRYSRTYGRKKPAPPPISQYDKLVAEPGNKTKPSATKTAGHVGKWGMTSFTSLRNINGGYGKEESGKRSYLDDSPPSSHTDDPFSFDSVDTTNGASHTTKPVATYGRPRKFFKSRGPTVVQETPKPGGSENKKGAYASPVSSTLESCQSSMISGSENKDSEIKSSPQYSTFDNVVPVSSGSQKSSDSGFGNHNVSSVSSVGESRGSDDGGGSVGGGGYGSGSGSVVKGSGGGSGSGNVVSGSGGGGSGSGSVTKSSSGIKLKIFKSRSVTSSSQETYSSTVELPSDDSRANSGASTPSTQDIGEDSKDSLIDDMPTKYSLPQYKNPQITSLINRSALETSQTSLNSSLDSSIEYSGLIDQRTGLLISSTEDESDLNNSCRSSVAAVKPYAKVTDTSRSEISDCQFSELACINIPTAQSNSRLDLEDSNDLFSSSTFPEDFDTLSGNVDSLSDPSKTPPIDDVLGETKTGEEPKLDSESPPFDMDAQKENFDLFSNDFDENDIVDRTQIDFQSDSNQGSKDQDLLNTDTQDLDDFELFSTSSQGSHASESYSRIGKRSGLTKYSSLDAKKLDQPAPMVKKRSIFKSRDVDHDAKKRATYKHKWHDQDEKEEGKKDSPPPPTNQSTSSTASPYDDFDFDVPATLKRVQTWPSNSKSLDDSMELEPAITSVKCSRAAKQYYTVVKNVKKTHQLQESGEFQEFNDDVEYFLDALRPTMPVSTRCLAALNLAQKCMVPAFRMHLRAHGTVIKFFSALSDAHADSRTALCAATVMFVLSQDRLNMDLDRDSLELMLNLLDTDAESAEEMSVVDAVNEQNKKKIRELCRDMQKKGHAKHLNLDTITAGQLAMETLLSLTSKRAGEWFKEELRELGGVDHLVRTITQCNQHFTPDMEVWTHTLLEKLSKVDRCLKVLENVTHQNRANQEYLLTYDDNSFPVTLMALYRLCHIEVPLYLESDCLNQTSVNGVYTSQILVQTLITTKKVLINLTHSSQKEASGSKVLGCQQELYDITLSCLLIMPRYLAVDKKFEVQVLSCCLLLNLVEHSRENRTRLMKTKAPELFPSGDDDDIFGGKKEPIGAMEALVNLFYKSEESAREQEAHTDQIIDNDLDKPDAKDEEKLEEIEETVTKLLQKAGRHMEDTLIAAYTALLTGYCIMEDEDREAEIRSMLPEGHFRTMVTVLKKFLRFMDLTATTSLLRSLKPTERVVKYMEKLDVDPEAEAEEQQQQQQLQLQQQLQQQALQQQQQQALQQQQLQQLQQQQLHEQPFMQLHSDVQQQQLQHQLQDQQQHLDDQLLEEHDEAYAFGF